MYLQSLEAIDAESIAYLASLLHPVELHMEPEEIADALEAAAQEDANYSMGFVDGARLHGYMLAWLEESRVEGNRESVLLIDDVLVDETASPQAAKLFRILVQNLEESGLGDVAIEAVLLASMQPFLDRHVRAFSALGYEVAASTTYDDEELGQQMLWVRYERPREDEAVISEEEQFVSADREPS